MSLSRAQWQAVRRVFGMTELVGDATWGGDWAWIRLALGAGGRIADARGEGPDVLRLANSILGLTPLEAAAVPAGRLAGDALALAIAPAVSACQSHSRVAVAMSGGVDSAVALLEARDAGCEVVGVTLRLWIDPAGPSADRACCSPSAVVAARELCHGLGVPHVTLDLREAFRRSVVGAFVEGYARGETPNPCTRCNGSLRFVELLAFSERVGARRLATGHYARVVEHRGRRLVARAADARKDQSYMLGQVDPDIVERLWFPLGELTKPEVRERATAAGLPAAGRPESQEACFLAGDDYRAFLARHGLPARDGPILDLRGQEVGRHDGFWRFTPGQRRGLRVASARSPLYAVATDPARNAVIVGARHALERTRIAVREGRLYVPVRRAEAKLRYRSPGVPASVAPSRGGFELALDEPVCGVAPGQSAVLYEDDAVVGAGVIAAAA
jgi:tRNA-specific 2-thiouridylase